MYIERVPNRNSPPAVLLRESYRENGKVRKRTLANLSKLPDSVIDDLRIILKGGVAIENLSEYFSIVRSLPYGHILAIWETIKKLNLHNLISPEHSPKRSLVLGMIVARILEPRSILGIANGLNFDAYFSSLKEIFKLEKVDTDELYAAIDWLVERQESIENALAKKHCNQGSLVLYELGLNDWQGTKYSWLTPRYNRDKQQEVLPTAFGLLCDQQGCPVAVELLEINTSEPNSLNDQIEKICSRFGVQQVVWIEKKDLNKQTQILANINKVEGLNWITGLRANKIRKLVKKEAPQLSLSAQKSLVEFSSADYSGERLIACRNPLLAKEKAVIRKLLVQRAEKKLKKIVSATQQEENILKETEKIEKKVRRILNDRGVGKYFEVNITSEKFSYAKKTEVIALEESLDGVSVIRTSVNNQTLDTSSTVKLYNGLHQIEKALLNYQSFDSKVRFIYHSSAERIKAHVFLCMLAYYVEWHMRKALAPLLFDEEKVIQDTETETSATTPSSQRSKKKRSKAAKKRKKEELPLQSFRTIMADLATITKNQIKPNYPDSNSTFEKITQPTLLQQKALDLLRVSLIAPSE